MDQASPKTDWKKKIYHIPAYTVADASRYLHIPLPTLNSWLKGRSYTTLSGKKEFLPLIERPNPYLPQLSFTNLVEAHVLRVIRENHNIHLKNVRIALDYISDQLKTPHPLVKKEFQTDGVNLFLDQIDGLVNASQSGQLAMREILDKLLTRIEWDESDIAIRLFPFIQDSLEDSSQKIITIDPKISFGKPTITGTGIPTKVIADLRKAGDSVETIANEYDCEQATIEKIIRFESRLKLQAA